MNRDDKVQARSVRFGSIRAPSVEAWGRHGRLELGSEGILRPGKFGWLRSIAWMIALLVALIFVISLQSIVRSIFPNPQVTLAMAFVCTALAYASYYFLVRWGEHRIPGELSLRNFPVDYLVGLLAGGSLVLIVMGVLWGCGAYQIRPDQWTDWQHDLRETIGTGLLEELLVRLVVFRLLSRAFGIPAGLLISAAAFGAAHLMNPNATISAAVAIAVEAGLLLAGFYFTSGRIWMSVGAHTAWNLTLGGVFGASVSGMTSAGSLLHSAPVPGSSVILTGATFGPEASLPAIILGFAMFLITLWLAPATPRN
ncbi:CPBP family intramembrane glutamic endopeptidase [Sphingomonas kyeonggiensis]|uniref:CAAX prenyl protease 2/Lysostaphin resistance protein A-like domain-containing protein n=1 Tax=Sphingomonas kyeonggiensis TaxID=1268553 RepID=A0A7W6NWX5_9SPHN|nr:CPBP family intramembrane glutamic endopeptidase [Sphingomonas kyeonggiensis]MBB4097944.1 hypothetical protein [Sphingomonas kyeonggiensis]